MQWDAAGWQSWTTSCPRVMVDVGREEVNVLVTAKPVPDDPASAMGLRPKYVFQRLSAVLPAHPNACGRCDSPQLHPRHPRRQSAVERTPPSFAAPKITARPFQKTERPRGSPSGVSFEAHTTSKPMKLDGEKAHLETRNFSPSPLRGCFAAYLLSGPPHGPGIRRGTAGT